MMMVMMMMMIMMMGREAPLNAPSVLLMDCSLDLLMEVFLASSAVTLCFILRSNSEVLTGWLDSVRLSQAQPGSATELLSCLMTLAVHCSSIFSITVSTSEDRKSPKICSFYLNVFCERSSLKFLFHKDNKDFSNY